MESKQTSVKYKEDLNGNPRNKKNSKHKFKKSLPGLNNRLEMAEQK